MILNIECNIKLRVECEEPLKADLSLEKSLRHIISEDLGFDFDIVVINDLKYNETEV